MHSGIAVSTGTLVVAAALGVTSAYAHHSFAPHFDSSKPVEHLGHRHRVRSAQSAQLRAHRSRRRERQDAGIRLRIARRHAAHAQRHHAGDAEGRHAAARQRIAVAPQPLHVLLRQRRVRGRPHTERQRPARARSGAAAAALAPRKDIFGTWLLAPIANRSTSGPQPMMQFLTPAGQKAVAAYDPFKDDPDVPLRSRRDPPRLGRARHAARDRPRRRRTSCCITSGWTCAASST